MEGEDDDSDDNGSDRNDGYETPNDEDTWNRQQEKQQEHEPLHKKRKVEKCPILSAWIKKT